MDFNEKERTRIVKDIVNYYVNNQESFDKDELRSLSDAELKDEWNETVGLVIHDEQDWSRDKFRNEFGESKWKDAGFNTIIEWQFDKLISTGIVDYRFDRVEHIQPY